MLTKVPTTREHKKNRIFKCNVKESVPESLRQRPLGIK